MRCNTLTQMHLDHPCSTRGCEVIGKDLRVKQPPRRIGAEAFSNSNLLQEQLWQKELRNIKKKIMCASNVHCEIKLEILKNKGYC